MDDEKYDIAMHPSLVPDFKEWLRRRGLHLAGPIPQTVGQQDVGSDSSFYTIGIGPYAYDSSSI